MIQECEHRECSRAMCDRRVRAERVLDTFHAPTFYTVDKRDVRRGAIIDLIKGGYTLAQVAAWFNVPRVVVAGLVARSMTDVQAEEALQLFREQKDGSPAIAEKLGLGSRQVSTFREAIGAPPAPNVGGKREAA